MKHLLFIMAVLLPALVHAEDAADTTFTVKDKKIVVDVKDDKTTVEVYDTLGYKMTKTREAEFVDGTEVERVFVGSPFVPTDELQNVSFRPRFPTVWIGMHYAGHKAFSQKNTGLNTRKSKSFELGFTPWSFAVPFTKGHEFGLTGGVQLVWVHQCFQKDWAVGRQDGRFTFTPLDVRATGNNMNYGALRVPLMLSMQDYYSTINVSVGLSAEVRTNAKYRLSVPDGARPADVPDGLKLNRFGLNFEMALAFGPFVISSTYGLTPTFKTTGGAKAFEMSGSIGLDLMWIYRAAKGKR